MRTSGPSLPREHIGIQLVGSRVADDCQEREREREMYIYIYISVI